MSLTPLLVIALLAFIGVFAFVWALDRRVAALEYRASRLAGVASTPVTEETR